MRYFWSLFWTFLLMQMLTYVISSMSGITFDIKVGTILTVVATIIIYAISAIIPNEPNRDEAH
nr:YjzD family protein [uncultured Bacillus sp.]